MYQTTHGPHLPQERRLVTEIPGPKSQELIKRRSEAVSAALGMSMPVIVERAGGGVIIDIDGNSIIDMGAGIAVVNVGNSADRVVANVKAQVEAFTHTCFMVVPYLGYIEVCEALNELTPGKFKKKSALFNSGAEALENAVKIARRFTKRQAIVVFEHGYHGRTNLTMAMTAKNMPYKDGFGPFAPEIYRMPMAYPYRWPGGAEACEREALDEVLHKIEKEIGGENLAGIVIEPIQGEGGAPLAETANAAGILIRSGYDPASVTSFLNLPIQHTGAAPVTLRDEAKSFDLKYIPNEDMQEAAIECFKRVLKEQKDLPEALVHRTLFERAESYALMGKKAMAIKDLEKILVDEPNYPEVDKKLAQLK
ncbi:MAG: aminotransferase class III-fold pyridoxal phosphate-dependent enzyme [Actinobacteria bacterium]|nr:aminotransferase class III-fold pyridoxal phosphate-dependent enzyme [Actinomycetota bacterium]